VKKVMQGYARMIIGVLVVFVFAVAGYISYTVIVLPLEYTSDALTDAYSVTGFPEQDRFAAEMNMFVWFLAIGFIVFICLLFLWLFLYAHKEEYEVF